MFIVILINVIVEEINKVGNNCLCALFFKKLYDVVIRKWHILNKNFANNTYTVLSDIFVNRELIKFINDFLAKIVIRICFVLARKMSNTQVTKFCVQFVR